MIKQTLLVSGSRNIPLIDGNMTMHLGFFERLIDRALANDWLIICGDANGVDDTLAYVTGHNKYSHLDPFLMMYGIQSKPRANNIGNKCKYTDVSDFYPTYTLRDEFMVSKADFVFCVWDGQSKGTKHVYDYALQQGFVTDENLWMKVVAT